MQCLDDDRGVERRAEACRIGVLELDPAVHSGGLRVASRGEDGRRIEIDADEACVRVGAGHRQRRPALAAADIGHQGGRVLLKSRIQVGDGGQPLLPEQMREGRAVEVGLAVAHVVAVVLPADAPARPVGLDQRGETPECGGHHAGDRSHQAEALGVDQDLGVRLRQSKPIVVIDLEDAADGLLLEPLPRIAGVGPGPRGELTGGCRAVGREAGVPSQAIAEVDPGEIEAPERGGEQALGQSVG